jgi:hypothetical protein
MAQRLAPELIEMILTALRQEKADEKAKTSSEERTPGETEASGD